jgi:hypothetical protein
MKRRAVKSTTDFPYCIIMCIIRITLYEKRKKSPAAADADELVESKNTLNF